MIKNLTPRLAERGKIKIGDKGEKMTSQRRKGVLSSRQA
jgi:hypothetical protein